MQRQLRSIIGYSIRAADGDLGKVHEFYFDDATWTIRYMVAETGNWLFGRKVLISLVALGKPDWESQTFSVNLTCVQVRNSPDIDTERPVYRQHEADLHEYYQWSPYWQGGYGGVFGITPYPIFENPLVQESSASKRQDDPHLRSTRQVTGYHIHATDGEIGHVEDFMVDDENWTIRYLVVDTGNWLLGRKVLISPKWIKKVNWADTSVYLDRSRESVKNLSSIP
ncbi:MAG: PRC-barrel domain-containing protein [Chitinispirillaceae bacterium]|jgi:sporulation protein YlmC with PRC-barrel domain